MTKFLTLTMYLLARLTLNLASGFAFIEKGINLVL